MTWDGFSSRLYISYNVIHQHDMQAKLSSIDVSSKHIPKDLGYTPLTQNPCLLKTALC